MLLKLSLLYEFTELSFLTLFNIFESSGVKDVSILDNTHSFFPELKTEPQYLQAFSIPASGAPQFGQ